MPSRWRHAGSEAYLARLIRSSCSGVSHDVGAAYATLGARTGALLDAIDRGRLALPPVDRDSVLRFARAARKIRAFPSELEGQALREAIADTFEISPVSRRPLDERGQRRSDVTAEFELAEPLAPEDPAWVAAWQKHFSASALNTYAECRRKWFFKYACAAVEDPARRLRLTGAPSISRSRIFTPSFLDPRIPRAPRCAGASASASCGLSSATAMGSALPSNSSCRCDAPSAPRNATWIGCSHRRRKLHSKLWDARLRQSWIWMDGLSSGTSIASIATSAPAASSVVDYKTGSIATSVAEYGEQVRRFRDFQLPFYYWARTAAGDRVTRLVLIPLKDALLDVRPIVLHVGKSIALDDLERSRARMIGLSNELASGEIRRFSPTENAAACAYCAYATACGCKPPAQTQRFGS